MSELINGIKRTGSELTATGRSRGDVRVLFVAEHDRRLESLDKELEKLGYTLELRQAPSFDSFKTALGEFSPEVILIELNLPGFDGVRAVDFLKDNRPDVPFILVSDAGKDGPDHSSSRDGERLADLVAGVLRRDDNGQSAGEPEDYVSAMEAFDRIFPEMESETGGGLMVATAGSNRPIFVNEVFAGMTGYSVKEILGMESFLRIIAPDDIAVFEGALENAAREGQGLCTFKLRITGKDGLITQLQITARQFDWENRKRIAMMVRDNPERAKDAVPGRRDADAGEGNGYWTVADSLPSFAVFDMDRDGKVLSWNPGAEQFTGYRRAEVIGTEFWNLLADGSAREQAKLFVDGSLHAGRLELETCVRRKGGEELRAAISLTRLFDALGRPGGFSAFVRRLQEDETINARMREREAQLHSLASHLQKAREEEKTLIARQLHDEFGQVLTALRMELSVLGRMISRTISEPLGRGSLLEKISSVSEVLEKAIRSARNMITELRPAVLDELGLLTAIQWQVMEFENRTGINCHITRLQHGETFDPMVSTTAFRILQEALDNVMRHSAATEAYISLQVVGANLVLEVSDNGKGIEADKLKAPSSIGIIGMRERVLALGGKLDVRGEPGRGTTLTVSIPRAATPSV